MLDLGKSKRMSALVQRRDMLGRLVEIKLGNETIGAIGAGGASGAKFDDAYARAGLDKIRDRLR